MRLFLLVAFIGCTLSASRRFRDNIEEDVPALLSEIFNESTTTTTPAPLLPVTFNFGRWEGEIAQNLNQNSAVELCPDNWVRVKESCYFFEHQILSFDDAEKRCYEQNATLFLPNSIAEWDRVRVLSPNSFFSWIGLHQEEEEGQLQWQSDDAINGTDVNWLIKPFDAKKNGWTASARCAAYFNPAFGFSVGSYTFFQLCSSPMYSICERNSTLLHMFGKTTSFAS